MDEEYTLTKDDEKKIEQMKFPDEIPGTQDKIKVKKPTLESLSLKLDNVIKQYDMNLSKLTMKLSGIEQSLSAITDQMETSNKDLASVINILKEQTRKPQQKTSVQ